VTEQLGAAGLASAQTGPPAAWTGAKGTPTRMLLVRHGQTEFSGQRRYSGRGNPALTEIGLRQAAAAAARLSTVEGVDAVVSSPLSRARQTADAIGAATGAPVTELAELVETDFGDWEGLTFAEASTRDAEAHRAWLADPSVPTPGGESFDQVHERVAVARDKIVAEYGGATVVVVSHVTPIKTLLRIGLDAGPSVLFRLHLDLASLSIVEFYPDGNTSVRLVNDTTHLAG
jgi:broad specificity phosphatase PhoE